MQEYIDYVQRGLRILLPAFSGYIADVMKDRFGEGWWSQARAVLSDDYNLPYYGKDDEMVEYLDIANCCKLVSRQWYDLFEKTMGRNALNYVKEIGGIRNGISHKGTSDVDQHYAERALDTMVLLYRIVEPETVGDLKNLYEEVRAMAGGTAQPAEYDGLAQPATESARGELTEGSLLNEVGSDAVQKTTMTRKVIYGGKTRVFPVYKVRLDRLFYNDQNDRIATWISQYESENGKDSLSGLSRDVYNRIIENFIVESNEESIQKTQKNISIVGQREPGVTLSDGRIVDGNRRLTCLRRLQRETAEPLYFETVIMDMDINADRKQIKLLELAIQHGEEKKVDYDLIDYAIGTYRDIVQTKLLTAEEYAASTNEPLAEINKRLQVAELISEFLEYIKLPEQYHAARDYQVYSLFQEMLQVLRKLDEEEQKQLKLMTFNNVVLGAIPDNRKYIRDIRKLVAGGDYEDLFDRQAEISAVMKDKLANTAVHSKEDLDTLAAQSEKENEAFQLSMERAMTKARSQKLKAKPIENVNKCMDLLSEVDPRMFSKLSDNDKENLKSGFDDIEKIIAQFRTMI